MKQSYRKLTVAGCGILFCLWWFGGLSNQPNDEKFYPKEDYAQDISKIYCDMGSLAEQRHDAQAAIKWYSSALFHKPDLYDACYRLSVCYQQIGNNATAVALYNKAQEILRKALS